jgi:hypothetical protein
MAEDDKTKDPATTNPELTRSTLPQGYRTGIISAITVLLGFSLAFFRFWGFEAPGKWTMRSAIPTGALVIAIFLEMIALFRSLRLEDNAENEYRKTVTWFIASAAVLVLALFLTVVESS